MEKIFESFKNAGQEGVFRFYDELSDCEKKSLLTQLEQVDLDELAALNKELVFGGGGISSIDYGKLKPAPYAHLPEDKASDPLWAEAKLAGEDALRSGKVAAFVVAGGMGTRLGFDAPKGLFKVSPVKHKSLFQIFAEKILCASKKYDTRIPWLIMTSTVNDAPTREFFKENKFFGLNEDDVIFFKQGLMPAVDKCGKILLSQKNEVAMTPDGHGGCFRAMCRSGAIAELKKRGVSCVSYFQVDNPLINIIDPYFIGFHLRGKSEMSSKAIPKAFALEKVGHFCVLDEKFCVIEYSDLPNEYQERRDADGNLEFGAGSVAIHIMDVDFIERLGSSSSALKLPFHRADKKISYIDEGGNLVKPEAPNAVKFEMFAFDALPMAANPVIIEGARADEFSPVKNAEGVDSPLTSKNDQKKQFAGWLEKVGLKLERDTSEVPVFDIEISPLFASNVEDFVSKWNTLANKPEIEDGFYLE